MGEGTVGIAAQRNGVHTIAIEKLSWAVAIAVLLTGHVHSATSGERIRPLLASTTTSYSIDLRGVEFKAGRPIKGEGLAASMKAPAAVSYQILDDTVATLKRNPEILVSMKGYSNSEEGSIIAREKSPGLSLIP